MAGGRRLCPAWNVRLELRLPLLLAPHIHHLLLSWASWSAVLPRHYVCLRFRQLDIKGTCPREEMAVSLELVAFQARGAWQLWQLRPINEHGKGQMMRYQAELHHGNWSVLHDSMH